MAGEPFEGGESAAAAPVSTSTPTSEEPVAAAPASATTTSTAEAEEGEDAKVAGDEEDTGAQVAPIVRLEEVAISTGEENEEVLLDLKAKLYRFDKEGKQWKERGVGQVKFLQHKESGKIRLLMRQSRTLKICANHIIVPATNLQEHAGSDKSWVWHASDYSDGELKEELFAIRLGSVDNAQKFKAAFEDAQDKVRKVEEKDDEEADEAAEALDSLTVGDKADESTTTADAATESEQPAVVASA